jgi:hypothetical protein
MWMSVKLGLNIGATDNNIMSKLKLY